VRAGGADRIAARLHLYFSAWLIHGEGRETCDDDECWILVIGAVVVTKREASVKSVITVECSARLRALLLLAAVALSGVLGVILLLGWTRPSESWKVVESILCLTVLYVYVAISFRWVVRLDEKQILRRELVRSRILTLDKVISIRVSEERKLLGWVSYLKIEIVGEEGRILVAWHKKKLEPLLEALRRRLPAKLEAVKSLPDV